jgi:uncharacterized membrane protein
MTQRVDTSPSGYAASMKPHNKFLSHLGNLLQWVGVFYIIKAHGWMAALPYVVLMYVFSYFLGVPPFINTLRCSEAYSARKGHMVMTLASQTIWVLALYWLLSLAKIADIFSFIVVLGAIRAFSMPRDQLMQERLEMNQRHEDRQSSGAIYFRSVPDTRMGAPDWNQPWTPPDRFPRSRFYRKLKEAHPRLNDLDAAFLIEETIYFFDDMPVKEPKRSELLLQKVEKEIDLYCSWSTERLTDWARNPVGTGMSRSTGRNALENDRWLLRRIVEEQHQEQS